LDNKEKINIELSIDEFWTILNNGKVEIEGYTIKLK